MKLVYTRTIFCLLIFFIPRLSFCFKVQDEIKGEKLLEMNLDELMNLSVHTGNITGLSNAKTPVAVTSINAKDIALTPARNIYDLLEIYVPGAIFFNHYDSPHLGMRGLSIDRNYKYLLLVNGRKINLDAHNGATSELEMWDLGDIEKIDIIRGPGSVTYGAGAVAGIISITTKEPDNKSEIHASTNYIYPYHSKGASVGILQKIGENSLYVYGGIQATDGFLNSKVYAQLSENKFGYFDPKNPYNRYPSDYYGDYNNLPQIKFNAQYNFVNNWSLFLRYTRQGATQNPLIGKGFPQIGFDSLGNAKLGNPVNILQTQDQHLTFSLKNETSFENLFKLSSMLSLSSEDYVRRTGWMRTFPKGYMSWDSVLMFQDLGNPFNHDFDFSESSILVQFLINKDYSDKFKMAAGTEFSLNNWGPGWGKDKRTMRLGDNNNIISGTDSYVYGCLLPYTGVPPGTGYYVGNGWSTITYSFLYELMWEIDPLLSVLVSARTDKNSYSKLLFSPRIAFISEISNNQILKLVIQRSQRMNTSSQLLIQHLSGKETPPEILDGIEMIHTGLVTDNISINSSVFYNIVDVISWYEVGRTTVQTGKLNLCGAEFEAKIIIDDLDIAFNQSYVKQLNWRLADSVHFSGISYSDYLMKYGNAFFSSSGNDLNNWSNFSTKLIINYKMLNDKLVFHLDSRIFWNFEGEKEGIKSFENGLDTSAADYLSLKEMVRTIKDLKMYGTDFRVNMAVTYDIFDNIKLSVYGMNLLGSGGNKRYVLDDGIRTGSASFSNGYIIEPLTIGLKLEYKY
ncbi:MAG: TonB-dependent receptor plug domain-containing protein [Candidatus Kapabacteria bacterium]|nr:TonB-dependent receptor plug domain-containing protein [Candidatus Kapabacteria bacterium]